jgi:hypothetical protein
VNIVLPVEATPRIEQSAAFQDEVFGLPFHVHIPNNLT